MFGLSYVPHKCILLVLGNKEGSLSPSGACGLEDTIDTQSPVVVYSQRGFKKR